MKLTNKLNLPEAILKAIESDSYSSGNSDISITGLLKPPRIVALERKFSGDLEEDASDSIWSLLGRSIHQILENAGNREDLQEVRLSMMALGWKVSGQFDSFVMKTKELIDYKITSAWSFKNHSEGKNVEWVEQLNLYRLLLEKNGREVEKLKIVCILRDWSKMEARRDSRYPQSQIQILEIPLWSAEEAEQFLHHRVKLHQDARENLPLCTEEEQWSRPNKWAVCKPGAERATRVFDTQGDAEYFMATNSKSKWEMKFRSGEKVRCESYCSVSEFCEQFKNGKTTHASQGD